MSQVTIMDHPLLEHKITMLRDAKSSVSSLGFKCAIMVIAIAPLIMLYPFVQRFFVKGILVGAVKG